VTVFVSSSGGCPGGSPAPAIIMIVNPVPDIVISASDTSICQGESVLFTSTITSGAVPGLSYQWYLNASPVAGANAPNWQPTTPL